jgi:hypothetical protein
MPEAIDKILELAERPAPQPPAALPISKSARFSRTSAFLALGSVMVFWLLMKLFSLVKGVSLAEATFQNSSGVFDLLLIAEIFLLPCLFIAVAITAIMGLIGAKRCPGNRKVVVWALVLTALAVAGFVVPLAFYLVRSIRLW